MQIRNPLLALVLGTTLMVPSLAFGQEGGGGGEPAADFDPLNNQVSRGNRATWDALFAGPPRGSMIQGELGFSGLPKVGYHMGMSNDMSLGVSFAFDYAYFAPIAAFRPGIMLQVPIRYRMYESGQLSVGLKAEPGIGFGFSPFVFSILLNAGVSIGYAVNNQIIVGGGVDMPIAIGISDGGASLAWPLLFGPMFEMHITPAVALTTDLKLGPWISTDGAVFGLKFMVGAAYRF